MSGIYRSVAGAAAVGQQYRALLDRWPVPNRQRHLPTRHGDTFVISSGPESAPPVLLLHGAGSNAATWLADVTAWSRRHRVHAVDLIGEPGLSAPTRAPLTSTAHADWLDDVLAGLRLSTATFVGMSLGGWLATDYATRHPDRVDRLALLCPGGIGRQRLGVIGSALLLAPFGTWGRRTLARVVLGPGSGPLLRRGEPFGEYLLLIQRQVRPRRVQLPVFADEALRRLTMPVLAIVGGRDFLFDSADTQRRLERNASASTVVALPTAGHLLLGQTERIAAFLSAEP